MSQPKSRAEALAEHFEMLAVDHEPDGWPAIRQRTLNEAAAELFRLSAEVEALRAHDAAQQEGILGLTERLEGLMRFEVIDGDFQFFEHGDYVKLSDVQAMLKE